MNAVCCIYQIKNVINGKSYIGSTLNVHKRYVHHINDLRNNNHDNPRMQADYNACGDGCFELNILEELSRDDNELAEREQYYIDLLNPQYNMRKVGNRRSGFTASNKTKKKMSRAHSGKKASWYGKKLPEDMKQRIAESHRGKMLGESNPSNKYTTEQILSVKRLINEGQWDAEISRRTGVSRYTVSDIRRGRRWQHLSIE